MPKEKPLLPAHVNADEDRRIPLPIQLSDHIDWLKGTEPIDAWLLVVAFGRYRLLKDEQVQDHPLLAPLRLLILEGKPIEISEQGQSQEQSRTAMVARLAPATISPPTKKGPRWRIQFPKTFDVFAPPDCDKRAFSILLTPEGHWEIWHTSVLQKAATIPFQELL